MSYLRFLFLLFGVIVTNLASSWAVELSQLHIPMTRDEADTTLSKDYESSVLDDGSIRRTWKQNGMTIFADFNSETQEAVLIAVIYDKPVPRKKGIADAHTIAAGKFDKEAKWNPPKDEQARQMVQDTFGLKNALRKKLKDKSMLFVETDESRKRIIRVSLFSRMPTTNRWTLKTVSKDTEYTAMGENWTPEHLAALYKDEDRRRAIPLKSGDQASVPSTESAAVTPSKHTFTVTVRRPSAREQAPARPQVESTAMGKASGSSSAGSAGRGGEKLRIKLDKGQRAAETATFLMTPPDWLKKVGIEDPAWWHYIVLGIVALLLVIAVLRSISHSMSAAASRKRFRQVVHQTPSRGNVKLHK